MDLLFQTDKRLKESRKRKLEIDKNTQEYRKLEQDIKYFSKVRENLIKQETKI